MYTEGEIKRKFKNYTKDLYGNARISLTLDRVMMLVERLVRNKEWEKLSVIDVMIKEKKSSFYMSNLEELKFNEFIESIHAFSLYKIDNELSELDIIEENINLLPPNMRKKVQSIMKLKELRADHVNSILIEDEKSISNDTELLFQDINNLIKRNKTKEAIELIELVCKNEPQNKKAWYWLGSLNSHLNNYKESVNCLEKAISIDKSFFEAFLTLGQVHFNKHYVQDFLILQV